MNTDVVIVGGGPAGASAALYLLRKGINPIIIEKENFPRYHIGESLTGECGGILRNLGLEQEMAQASYPIKHGVRVYGHNHWFVPVRARTENGLRDVSTWQVRRSEFDKMLLDAALSRGATLIRGQATKAIINDDGGVGGIYVQPTEGQEFQIKSQVVLDCSGQTTFLANLGVTGPKYRGNYDKQMAVFSQVVGGIRDNGQSRAEQKDNTLIFYKSKYHWGWWIPLDNEAVSVGIVSPSAYFLDKRESKKQFLTRELHELHPELTRRLPEINLVEDVRSIPNYSFQVKNVCGKGYICIGDSHRFVDPIFSFGVYVGMKEAEFAADAVADYLNGSGRYTPNPFAAHQLRSEKGIDLLEDTIDTFWEHPLTFAWFTHSKHIDSVVDIFAGRIFNDGTTPEAATLFRRLLKRERSYDNDDIYSIPIGSRYHPERAPLWDESASIVVE